MSDALGPHALADAIVVLGSRDASDSQNEDAVEYVSAHIEVLQARIRALEEAARDVTDYICAHPERGDCALDTEWGHALRRIATEGDKP